MFQKFRVNVSFNILSQRIYSGTLGVETSQCLISFPGKHANFASSTHLKSKPIAYIHI